MEGPGRHIIRSRPVAWALARDSDWADLGLALRVPGAGAPLRAHWPQQGLLAEGWSRLAFSTGSRLGQACGLGRTERPSEQAQDVAHCPPAGLERRLQRGVRTVRPPQTAQGLQEYLLQGPQEYLLQGP